ncbi:MAG: transposase family protein [Acidimicrobiales bacterium]
MTHWVLEGEKGIEIVNFIDGHSRLCLASVALPVTKVLDVLTIFQSICDVYGIPASVLTEAICTARRDADAQLFETELERLGVVARHASPSHPQTCGKVGRFHQTMKRYLGKQPGARTLKERQRQLAGFVRY